MRAQIGREVLAAREQRVRWKTLERRYRYGRTQLWTFMCEALSEQTEQNETGIGELM